MARVDVQQREGDGRGIKRFFRQVDHHDGIFAAGKEQERAFELGGDLAHDEDRLVLQLLAVSRFWIARLRGGQQREALFGDFRRFPGAA